MQAKVELEKSGNLYESGNYMVQNYTYKSCCNMANVKFIETVL